MNAFLTTNLDTFRTWIDKQRARRREARTQLFLASLPEYVRKDIGWPDGRTTPAPLPQREPKWDAEAFLARTQCRLG